jgi:hypothetical protein
MTNSNPEENYSPRRRSAHEKNIDTINQLIVYLLADFLDEIKTSEEPEDVKKLLRSKTNEVGALLLNMYRKNPDKYSISCIRAKLRSTKNVLTKLQKDRQRYSTDNAFRKRKIVQMQEWRRRPGNTERERITTVKRLTAPPKTVFTF